MYQEIINYPIDSEAGIPDLKRDQRIVRVLFDSTKKITLNLINFIQLTDSQF
jgi:hypothetical protein